MKEFYVNTNSEIPAYKQIVGQIKLQIKNNLLKKGERLPTVRELAIRIHVNPNTVARAYRELERNGFIETFIGRGTFVTKKEISEENKIINLIDELIKTAEENSVSINEIIKKIKERSGEK